MQQSGGPVGAGSAASVRAALVPVQAEGRAVAVVREVAPAAPASHKKVLDENSYIQVSERHGGRPWGVAFGRHTLSGRSDTSAITLQGRSMGIIRPACETVEVRERLAAYATN